MSQSFQMLVAGYSVPHTRTYNQDRIYPEPSSLPATLTGPACVAVADGMGGTQQGTQAATLAIQAIASLEQTIAAGTSAQQAIPATFRDTNQKIIDQAGGPGISGTTLSFVVFGPRTFWLGHLGDSRIYLWRQRQLHLLTTDDNAFVSLTRKGHVPFHPQQLTLTQEDRAYLNQHQLFHNELFYIPPDPTVTPPSSRSLGSLLQGRVAELHQQGHIIPVGATRERIMWALGKQPNIPLSQTNPNPPAPLSPELQAGDLFLLCTDGLHGVFTHDDLQQRVQQVAHRLDPQKAQTNLLSWGCDFLLQEACDAGSNDNISLLLVQVLPAPPTSPKQEKPVLSSQFSVLSSQLGSPSVAEEAQRKEELPALEREKKAETSPEVATDTQDYTVPLAKNVAPALSSQPELPGLEDPIVSMETPFWQRPAVLYVVIGILAFLLLGVLLRRGSSVSKVPSRLRMVKHGTLWQPDSPVALFWLPLPKSAHQPMVAQRIAALRSLYDSYYAAQTLWQLSPETHQPLIEAMKAPALRYHRLRRVLAKVPLESQHFQAWDHALQRAMHRLLRAVAPKYKQYLDEIGTSVPLPSARVGLSLSKQAQHQYRRALIRRWRRHVKALRWQSWQLELATERILLHPQKPDATKQARLQRCVVHLRRAHHILQQKNPQHPLLPALHNRIQLYQVLLQKSRER